MPFKKGDPNINRKGRTDGGGLNLTKLLKDKLQEIPEGQKKAYKELFIETLLHKALIAKDLQALRLIMNYVDGLPTQVIDVSGILQVLVPKEVNDRFELDEEKKDEENNKIK